MHQKNRTQTFGLILIIIGLIGLISMLFNSYIGYKISQNMVAEFQQLSSDVFEGNDVLLPGEDKKEPVKDTEALNKKGVIAILSIPALDISYPIKKGTDAATLKYSLAYHPDTTFPNEIGNFAVAGHRNSSYSKYFRDIPKLKIGDEIIVETKDVIYTYLVSKESYIVKDTDLSVLNHTNEKTITLITCTKAINPKERVIIKGNLLKEELK